MNYEIGQMVNYTNGSPSVYTGTVVKIIGNYLTVVSEGAEKKLWDLGFSVGAHIHTNQIIEPVPQITGAGIIEKGKVTEFNNFS